MHANVIITRVLGNCLSSLHLKQQNVLKKSVSGLMRSGVASLSGIAQGIHESTTLRHQIKSVDRLLGNYKIAHERETIYQKIAHYWLAKMSQALIIIDWSDITRDQKWQQLRASVALQGRSFTIYEEVHPRELYANRHIQTRFLQKLKHIIPLGCTPIILSVIPPFLVASKSRG